jgi:predicted CDP-diglyceride synthetase/phosphatidate cytidylyltransferase
MLIQLANTLEALDPTRKFYWLISAVAALLLLSITNFEGQNTLLLFYFLLVVQLSDLLHYVFGNLFGKTEDCTCRQPK